MNNDFRAFFYKYKLYYVREWTSHPLKKKIQYSSRILYFLADHQNCAKFPSLKCTHILFLLNPNSITPQNTLHLLPIPLGLLVLPCIRQCRRFLSPPPLLPHPFFFLSWTEKPALAGTCAHDRHALQQLALNVHVKHSDLTCQ